MIPLVIDSSVAIKWFVQEPYSEQAILLLDAYKVGKLSFYAPELMRVEAASIAWKKWMFQDAQLDDVEKMLAQLQQLSIRYIPDTQLLPEAWKIAVQLKRTIYDSLYLTLAIRLDCMFVTADEKLVNATSSAIPQVVWVQNIIQALQKQSNQI